MRRNTLTKLGLNLLIIILGMAYLIWQGFSIWNKWVAIQNERKLGVILKDLKAGTDKAYQKIGSLEEVQKKIKVVIPTDPQREELMAELQKICTKSGLMLSNIKFENLSSQDIMNEAMNDNSSKMINTSEPMKKKIKSFSMNLSLIGSYVALKNFLREIRSSQRIIRITSVNFNSGGKNINGSGETDLFNFNVTGESYYWSK